MTNSRYYNNINYAPYGTFLDWAASADTTNAVSSWDITLRPDWVGEVFDLTINGNVVGGFQSRSVALSALWGYHATQSGETSVTAFEAAVGDAASVQPDMGTLSAVSAEVTGQPVTVTFTGWDSAVAMPTADDIVATLQQYSSLTGQWSTLASGVAGTSFTYTLEVDDVGTPKRVGISSPGYMPLRFPVDGTPTPPTARSVDKTPFYINYFAATADGYNQFGVGGDADTARLLWLKTPLTSEADSVFNDSATNGRKKYIEDKWENQALDGRKWNRVMIGNPAGYVAGDRSAGNFEQKQGYFSNNQGTGMSMEVAQRFDNAVSNASVGSDNTTGLLAVDGQINSPFRPSGLSGASTEDLGDSAKAWSAALDHMRSLDNAPNEIYAYIGYGYNYTDTNQTTFDNATTGTLAYAPGWARSDKEPDTIDVTNWTAEWDILGDEAGFDNVSFDAGTRIARYGGDTDTVPGDARIAAIAGVVGTDNQIYEAIDRTTAGGPQYTGTDHYRKAKSWALFPASSGITIDGTQYGGENTNGTSSVVQIDNGWADELDSQTEVHIVFDLNNFMTDATMVDPEGTPRLATFDEVKAIIDATVAAGFVASATSWNNSDRTDTNGDTFNAGDIADYLISSQETSRPLEHMTYLMEDAYSGGYAQAAAENSDTNMMTWVLGRGNMFPRDVVLPSGTTVEVTLPMEMSSDDARDAWAIAWTDIALEQLASKVANGLTVDGSAICMDPEDKGVDSAPGGVDMRYAGSVNTNTPLNAGFYKDSRIGFNPAGDPDYFTTEVVDALPRAIEAMKRVTNAVRAAYPNSPVGWYNGGVSFYLPSWQGSDQDHDNSAAGTMIQIENMFKGLTSRDSNYYQHQVLDNSDFGFVPWYRGIGNGLSTEPTSNSNDDNEIVSRGYFGHFNLTNKIANGLYLYLKYLGPNTTHGDADMGSKMILGLIQGYMATDGELKNLDGTDVIGVRAAKATSSGGAYPSSDSAPAESSSLPAEWAGSDLSYPDLSGLRGAGNLFTDVIDSPYDSTASGSGIDENGVFNVPFTLPEWNDYVSWLYTEDNQDLVNAGLQRSGVPSQIFERGMPAGYEGPTELTDSLRDMRMSIFDGTMPTEYSYVPGNGGSSNTVRSLNSSWASGTISSSKTRYMELLYAGYADYAGYNGKTWATQPATNEDLFLAADKANWFDPFKKAFAERVIDRTNDKFYRNDTLTNISTFNQMNIPFEVAKPNESYEVMLSGYVYLDPSGSDLSTLDLSTTAALSIATHRDRIQDVVTGPAGGQPSDSRVENLLGMASGGTPYTGYIAYDLEQPAGFVQTVTSRPLDANTNGTANSAITAISQLSSEGQAAAADVIQLLGRTLIAHHLEFPAAKLAVYGLGNTQPSGFRTSNDSGQGTYEFRREMYQEILNYTETFNTVVYTVKDIIDLALVKQYASSNLVSGGNAPNYKNCFDDTYAGTSALVYGIRESFRWMLPQLFALTGAEDIKVALLSTTSVEGSVEDLIYDYFQDNLTAPPTNDAAYRFAVIQQQQAEKAWEEAGMNPTQILKPKIWGNSADFTNKYYQKDAYEAQDDAFDTYSDSSDVLIAQDSNPNSSTSEVFTNPTPTNPTNEVTGTAAGFFIQFDLSDTNNLNNGSVHPLRAAGVRSIWVKDNGGYKDLQFVFDNEEKQDNFTANYSDKTFRIVQSTTGTVIDVDLTTLAQDTQVFISAVTHTTNIFDNANQYIPATMTLIL